MTLRKEKEQSVVSIMLLRLAHFIQFIQPRYINCVYTLTSIRPISCLTKKLGSVRGEVYTPLALDMGV